MTKREQPWPSPVAYELLLRISSESFLPEQAFTISLNMIVEYKASKDKQATPMINKPCFLPQSVRNNTNSELELACLS